MFWASLVAQMVKKLPAAVWETWVHPWFRKIPWRRNWQPLPVFLPGGSHGQRSLVGYSPQGHNDLDTTEPLHFNRHLSFLHAFLKVKALVTQWCLTPYDPMDCSPPGSSVYGILQARILISPCISMA